MDAVLHELFPHQQMMQQSWEASAKISELQCAKKEEKNFTELGPGVIVRTGTH
jgi:hypothetical protein